MINYAFEALKKLCKKYRYMFRSDNLYTEMNYVIENLSPHLLLQATNCMEASKVQTTNIDIIQTCL